MNMTLERIKNTRRREADLPVPSFISAVRACDAALEEALSRQVEDIERVFRDRWEW
jgi:hypothetical protein